MLREGRTGTLALTGDNGYPYSVPVNYTVADGKVLFHGAKDGYKADLLQTHPNVSMSVILRDELDSVRLTTIYASVILFGEAKELQGAEKLEAAALFTRRYSDDQRAIDVLPPHTRDFSRELGGRAFYLQGLNSYGIN